MLRCPRKRVNSNSNGVVERFHESLKYEHLYQREIANAAELAEEVAAYITLYNEARPHESLALEPPLAIHRGDAPIPGLSLQEG